MSAYGNACWKGRGKDVRVPGRGESVGGMGLLVLGDGALEALLAHVAPRTHRVGDDVDVEMRHCAPESHDCCGGGV